MLRIVSSIEGVLESFLQALVSSTRASAPIAIEQLAGSSNANLAKAKAQEALGWDVGFTFDKGTIRKELFRERLITPDAKSISSLVHFSAQQRSAVTTLLQWTQTGSA